MVFWKRGLPLLVLTCQQRSFASAFAPSALRRSIALFAQQENGDGGMDATARAFLAYQVAPVAPSASNNSNPPAPFVDNTKLEQEMEAQYAEIEAMTPRRVDDVSGSGPRNIADERDSATWDPPVENVSRTAYDAQELEQQRESLDDVNDRSNLGESYAIPEQQFVDSGATPLDYSSRNDADAEKDQRAMNQEYDDAREGIERRNNQDDVAGQSMLMRSAEKLGLLSDAADVEEAKTSAAPMQSSRDESRPFDIKSENTKRVDSSDPVPSLAMDQGADSEIPIVPPANTEAVVTKVTTLASSDANSVVATTRAKQRIREDEEKPHLLLQILSDIVFSSDDSPKEKQVKKEKRTPVFDDLTEKLKSSIVEEAKPGEQAQNVAAPPETYYFNVNAQKGKWNPNEEDNVFRNESSQRPWTASLDSRGNFCVTYFDDDTVPVAPKRTGKRNDEWDQYENVSGRVYFVNRETGESQWDVPPGFEIVETPAVRSGLGENDANREEEEKVVSTPDYRGNSRVVVESKEEVTEKTDAEEEDISSLTPIQRLLGKMTPAEKAELSAFSTRKASEDVLKPQAKQTDNAIPLPIQKLLGKMQGIDETAFTEQLSAPEEIPKRGTQQTDKGLTPIQRFLQKDQAEKGDEPEPQKQPTPKPFWSQTAKESIDEEPPPDKPRVSWPFWKK